MSKAKGRRRREPVYIRHNSGQYVHEFVMGYVDEVTARTRVSPVEFERGRAEWAIRKLPAIKQAEYTIEEIPGIAYERKQPNPGAVLGEAVDVMGRVALCLCSSDPAGPAVALRMVNTFLQQHKKS